MKKFIIYILLVIIFANISIYAGNTKESSVIYDEGNSSNTKKTYHSAETTLASTTPTHLYYTALPDVDPMYGFVAGLHEISFGLGSGWQVQASILEHISDLRLGFKFGLMPNVALGFGLAGKNQLGLFYTQYIRNTSYFKSVVSISGRVGFNGADSKVAIGLGMGQKMNEMFSVIGELGFWGELYAPPDNNPSIDEYRSATFVGGSAGIRLHPPAVPILFIDLGASFNAVVSDEINSKTGGVSPYFDIMVGIIL